MALFSRAFFRKRVVSLVTTASVAASSFALAQDPKGAHHVGSARIHYVADRPDHSEEHPFLSENAAAMKKMMVDMTIKPSGDVDRDFVEMMVPHHQGAIDMAQAELKYGHNAQLRRLAQQIVKAQQSEIVVMRRSLGDKQPPSTYLEVQPGSARAPQDGAASSSMDRRDVGASPSMEMK